MENVEKFEKFALKYARTIGRSVFLGSIERIEATPFFKSQLVYFTLLRDALTYDLTEEEIHSTIEKVMEIFQKEFPGQ
jgi:hypothetical protein